MTCKMPDKLKQDIIKLLKDSVKSYRVRELRECIETYNRRPLCAPPKTARKAYLLKYLTVLLEEMGQSWTDYLPLQFITKILELECRARNDFMKRYHVLNTSLEIEESPFYEVVHVLAPPTLINSGHVVVFRIPFNWGHLFSKEKRQAGRCSYEVQLFLESAKEGEEWEDVHVRLLKNGSDENPAEFRQSGPILYVTDFFLDEKRGPDSFLGNRHRVDVEFPSSHTDFSVRLSVRIVKRISVSQLVKSYPVVKTCRLAYLLDDFFSRSAFMACTVSLFSSFEQAIMEVPCRGSGCAHPDVFDLREFLREAQFRLRWACPVCLRHLTYSSLEVDVFFQSFRGLSGKLNYTFKRDELQVPLQKGQPICTIELD